MNQLRYLLRNEPKKLSVSLLLILGFSGRCREDADRDLAKRLVQQVSTITCP